MTQKILFIKAYLWNMLGKFFVRSMGLVSTLVLVRLLSPSDFGLIAIATMVMGFFEVLTNASINRYLILHTSPTDRTYNTAWTLNIIFRTLAFLLVVLLANTFSNQMENSDLTFVIQFVALASYITAFNSIGLIELEREINYSLINKLTIFSKLISSVITITCAFYYRSYIALIVGTTVFNLLFALLSHKLCTRKSKFDFSFDKRMLTFSSFILIRNLISYSRSQIDILIVGKSYGETALGQFSIARQFSTMPLTEIITPALQPAFSVLSRLKNNKNEFNHKIYQSLFYSYLFLVPAACGIYVLQQPFVQVVLGEKWMPVSEYIGYLAFLMIPFATQPVFNTIYDAIAKTQWSIIPDLAGLLSILSVFLIFIPEHVSEFAQYRVIIGLFSFTVSFLVIRIFYNLSTRKLLIIAAIPIIPSIVMCFIIGKHLDSLVSPISQLISFSFIGFLIYIIGLFLIFASLCKLNPNSWLLRMIPDEVFSIVLRKAPKLAITFNFRIILNRQI